MKTENEKIGSCCGDSFVYGEETLRRIRRRKKRREEKKKLKRIYNMVETTKQINK